MRVIMAAAFVVATLSGCGEKSVDRVTSTTAESKSETPAKPVYTKEIWRSDLLKPFHVSGVETDDDGMTKYLACQSSSWTSEGKCKDGYFAFGKRDAFRKLDHLTPTWTRLDGISNSASNVGIYIAAVECKPIEIILAPAVHEKSGWLFMRRVSLLADGELAFERSFELHDVERDNDARLVHERADFVLKSQEIDQLRKYSSASQRVARLTGDKGYITIAKEPLEHFNKDLANILMMYDDINKVQKYNGGPACTTAEVASAPPAS
ncbi:hypothetical protein [Delftia sp. ZNC0008]|uniref:hypothetical protein n=1 Tax=Delftia sp. ZNC0008 TaxID=1339242 RepID=UPI0012E06649|nr:hypothetical protein [Delftia sp. ZNC0008]